MSFIGIDTSNYTTSLSISRNNVIEKNIKIPLKVESGERGLRQSDAVFQHTVNLPKAFELLGKVDVTAVGVSSTPRDEDGSYMPCFLSGVAAANVLSSTLGVPLYKFSHQRGHIAAALYSCGREDLYHKRFIAFHVSGGTTEITLFENGKIKLLGGTKDISCGKAIDRIGVKLGLDFPCGKALSDIASDPDSVKVGKVCVNGLNFNLSGIENKADELIKNGADSSYVASFVLAYIAKLLTKLTENALIEYKDLPVLYAGGVMSNTYLKGRLNKEFESLFAEPEFSSDNACGIARLTSLRYEGKI